MVVRLGAACRSVDSNQLSELPTGVFDGLTALDTLYVAQEREPHTHRGYACASYCVKL